MDCKIQFKVSVKAEDMTVNKTVALGYKFRRDVNKLLKIRKKRRQQNFRFYGQDLRQILTIELIS